MHPLKQLELPDYGYAIANRLIHWLSEFLVKNWDKKLLGVGQLPIATILDIGANEGQFSRQMRRRFPAAQIYAFEPLPAALLRLQKWANSQQDYVKIFPYALGEITEEVQIQQHLYFNASSSLLSTTTLCEELYPITGKQQAIAIQQIRLDELIIQFELSLVGDILIKLDVQGYEDRVIRGGTDTFKKAKACIVEISLDTLYEGQAQFTTIFQLLSDLGFHYAGNLDQMAGNDGHIIYCNALFLR